MAENTFRVAEHTAICSENGTHRGFDDLLFARFFLFVAPIFDLFIIIVEFVIV